MMRPKIYLFGDSITEDSFINGGWGANLANHFARTADVVLRGYSGYNTRWAFKVIKKVFPAPEVGVPPAAVTVFFGANDACLPDRCSAFQHVPVEEYKKNLHAIVDFLKGRSQESRLVGAGPPRRTLQGPETLKIHEQWPNTHVILITPPPIDEPARLLHPFTENLSGLPERTNEAAGAYAKACLAVATERGVRSIDLWTIMQKFPGWQKSYLTDGLHLTDEGNRVVFDEVIARLKDVGVSLETLPVDLPLIGEINPMEPLTSFDD